MRYRDMHGEALAPLPLLELLRTIRMQEKRWSHQITPNFEAPLCDEAQGAPTRLPPPPPPPTPCRSSHTKLRCGRRVELQCANL